jgi:hypothetical protein
MFSTTHELPDRASFNRCHPGRSSRPSPSLTLLLVAEEHGAVRGGHGEGQEEALELLASVLLEPQSVAVQPERVGPHAGQPDGGPGVVRRVGGVCMGVKGVAS